MIRINLLPVEEARRAAGRRQEMAVATLAVAAAVLLLVVAHGWQQARMAAANRELRHLAIELTAIQGPYADVTRLEQQKQELHDKLRVIAQLEAKKVGPVRILADLSTATPDKLWLTEFNDTGGSLKLAGLGVDEQTVADFMRRLGALPFFRSVDLDETSQVDQDGTKLKQFVIHASIDFASIGAAPPTAAASAATPGTTAGVGR
jgi:type IV pilus assembly protein PilN